MIYRSFIRTDSCLLCRVKHGLRNSITLVVGGDLRRLAGGLSGWIAVACLQSTLPGNFSCGINGLTLSVHRVFYTLMNGIRLINCGLDAPFFGALFGSTLALYLGNDYDQEPRTLHLDLNDYSGLFYLTCNVNFPDLGSAQKTIGLGVFFICGRRDLCASKGFGFGAYEVATSSRKSVFLGQTGCNT